MISPDLLRAATGCTPSNAARYAPHLSDVCEAYAINTLPRVSAFLAQIGHESAGLSRVVENLNYSVEALLKLFGRHRIVEAAAHRYGRKAGRPANQEALANILYGGEWGRRNLGNTEPGDGWKYRGRGLKQITGRGNYQRVTTRLRRQHPTCPDFEVVPDALQLDKWACWSAGDFWMSVNGNTLADGNDFEALTRQINGGINGLDDRQRRLTMALAALGDSEWADGSRLA